MAAFGPDAGSNASKRNGVGAVIPSRSSTAAPGYSIVAATNMYLGIDIGGTFTDLVLMDESGNISTAKAPTTPGELEKGVFDAVALAAQTQGLTPEDLLGRVSAFGHGTTQATNALIERTGAATGLIATRGFGDTLMLQRLMGFTAGIPVENLGQYSRRRYPQPIVPRRLIREVRERIDQAGHVLVPLDEGSVRTAVRELIDAGAKTFAVALLWSFRNPAHERRVGEIIREMAPGAYVSLSCEVSPIIGEYERTATTVLNSYLAPKVADYLDRIESLLRAARVSRQVQCPQLGGRRHSGERSRAQAGPAGRKRPGRRRDGLAATGAGDRPQQRHHHRHGRHELRRGFGRRRQSAGLRHSRSRRLSSQHAGDRHPRHRRRRRLDRARRSRTVAGRAGQRRRGARAGLLWPRRQACHRYRCRSGARHSLARQFSRRPHEARPRGREPRRSASRSPRRLA